MRSFLSSIALFSWMFISWNWSQANSSWIHKDVQLQREKWVWNVHIMIHWHYQLYRILYLAGKHKAKINLWLLQYFFTLYALNHSKSRQLHKMLDIKWLGGACILIENSMKSKLCSWSHSEFSLHKLVQSFRNIVKL